jgi:RNA polymerase sigma-70 factor (ECF subfamily)
LLQDFPSNCEFVDVRAFAEEAGRKETVAATRSSLVNRLKDWRDENSWQDFFDTYWRLIYTVAIKAGLSEAEARDVVQETVVAVARQLREGRYDRNRASFKNWLCLITRRRVIDHFRRRTDPNLLHRPPNDSSETGLLERVPDSAIAPSDAAWDEEWRKNLLDAAIERVRLQVAPKQFQIFDLSVIRGIPVSRVTEIVKVNAAQVYLARHRVRALVKKEVQRLEKGAERLSSISQ